MSDRSPDIRTAPDAVLRRYTGYNLKRAFNAMQADLAEALAPLGLRMMTFSALAVVAENPGLSQSQLAEALTVERSNLVVILDELERLGLVARSRAPHDRRTHALHATAAGRRRAAEAARAVDAHEARILRGLDPASRRALRTALAAIERGASGARETAGTSGEETGHESARRLSSP